MTTHTDKDAQPSLEEDKGFWGRAAARLSIKNKELQAAVAERDAVIEVADASLRRIHSEVDGIDFEISRAAFQELRQALLTIEKLKLKGKVLLSSF